MIKGFQAGKQSLYNYAVDDEIPDIIARNLDEVEKLWPHGTAVIIPAFNNFNEDDSLWNMVSYAASANFFGAIASDELIVSVDDNRDGLNNLPSVLDSENLSETLEQHRTKKRAKAFLSGNLAYDAFQAYRFGKKFKVTTSLGIVEVRLTEESQANTRVHLCRNGMWITDAIPRFYGKFADRVPFCAVVLIDSEDGGEFYELIRSAESPLHNDVNLKGLSKSDRNRCGKAFSEVVERIREMTKGVEPEIYFPDDYLTLDSGSDIGKGGGHARRIFVGEPSVTSVSPLKQFNLSADLDVEPNSDGDGKKKRVKHRRFRSDSRKRPSLPQNFQSVSRPTGPYKRKVVIVSNRDVSNAEMRLIVDEALDATCDRPGQDEYAPAILTGVHFNGSPVGDDKLSYQGNDVIGVCLGDLHANVAVEVDTEFRFAGDFEDLPCPSLRVQVFRRQEEHGGYPSTDADVGGTS